MSFHEEQVKKAEDSYCKAKSCEGHYCTGGYNHIEDMLTEYAQALTEYIYEDPSQLADVIGIPPKKKDENEDI